MSESKLRPITQSRELVEADLYDDLLCRYERALVYAGEIREKLRAQDDADEHISRLKGDVSRLQKSVAVDEAMSDSWNRHCKGWASCLSRNDE